MRSIGAGGISINFKPALVVLILVTIIYTPGYFVSAGYADDETAEPVNHKPAESVYQDTAQKSEEEAAVEKWDIVRIRVTAYCPCPKCCGEYSDGITASGHKIIGGDRFVAADGKYAFGTEMAIPGYNDGKPVKVLDRGGAIKGKKLDVFFNTHQEALEWGVKYIDVKILK